MPPLVESEVQRLDDRLRDAQGAMQANMGILVERDAQLGALHNKSVSVQENTALFSKQAKRIKWQQRIHNFKMLAAVIFVLLVLCVFVATKGSLVNLIGSEFLLFAAAFGLYHLVDKLLLRQSAPAEETEDVAAIE
mmetsp:Transcript_2541/g.5906  ORF Transcript_2541/g.5906 Transcript_2541/m.5906 type:complete len:136 (-) Transcript_2541:77-484(-)